MRDTHCLVHLALLHFPVASAHTPRLHALQPMIKYTHIHLKKKKESLHVCFKASEALYLMENILSFFVNSRNGFAHSLYKVPETVQSIVGGSLVDWLQTTCVL